MADFPWRTTADDVPLTRMDEELLPKVVRGISSGLLNDGIAELVGVGKDHPREGRMWRDSLRSIGIVGLGADIDVRFRGLCDMTDEEMVRAIAAGALIWVPEVYMSRDEREHLWGQARLVITDDMHTAADSARRIIDKYGIEHVPADELSPVYERDTRFITTYEYPGGRSSDETQCPWCFVTVRKNLIGDFSACRSCEETLL